jgi:hypothetical protein
MIDIANPTAKIRQLTSKLVKVLGWRLLKGCWRLLGGCWRSFRRQAKFVKGCLRSVDACHQLKLDRFVDRLLLTV